jgi:hypothetical protein
MNLFAKSSGLSLRFVGLMGLMLVPATADLLAQTPYDAQRFSETSPLGTTRSLSMGGAASTIGGDLSATVLNPAGLGLYQRSTLVLTPVINLSKTDTDYLGSTGTGSLTNFGIANWGLGLHVQSQGRSLRGLTFAITQNQLENHYRRASVSAFNPSGSVSQYLAAFATANGVRAFESPNNLSGGFNPNEADVLAFNTGWAGGAVPGTPNPIAIIDNQVDNNGNYIADRYFGAFQYGNINQTFTLEERGRTNLWNLSFAANFDDRLFIGGGVGISDVNYTSNRIIYEEDTRNLYAANTFDTMAVQWLQFSERVSTAGAGINANVGVIYQPIDELRVGLSVSTPTLMYLTDTYSNSAEIKADAIGNTQANTSNENAYDYTLTTPYRVTLGAVGMLPNKIGLVSVDADLTDYSSARFEDRVASTSGYFNFINNQIGQIYQMAFNVRAGVELRYKKLFFRGGFGLFGQPVQSGRVETASANKVAFSGGVGYRTKNFFFDLGFVNIRRPESIAVYPYYQQVDALYRRQPFAQVSKSLTNVVFTLGFHFGRSEE